MKKMINGVPTPIHSVNGNPPIEMFEVLGEESQLEKELQEFQEKRKSERRQKLRQQELERKKEQLEEKQKEEQQLMDALNASIDFETKGQERLADLHAF